MVVFGKKHHRQLHIGTIHIEDIRGNMKRKYSRERIFKTIGSLPIGWPLESRYT